MEAVFGLLLLESQYYVVILMISTFMKTYWCKCYVRPMATHIGLLVFVLQSSSTRNVQLSVRDALNAKREESQKDSEAGNLAHLDSSDDDEAYFDARMRMQILKKRKELGDLPPKPKLQNGTSIIFHIF